MIHISIAHAKNMLRFAVFPTSVVTEAVKDIRLRNGIKMALCLLIFLFLSCAGTRTAEDSIYWANHIG